VLISWDIAAELLSMAEGVRGPFAGERASHTQRYARK
jgi:hypothetical protein